MSKVDGTMYKCDMCGKTKFLSCADIAKDSDFSTFGIHRLSVGKKNNMHLCERCYFILFSKWFDKVYKREIEDEQAHS